MLRYCGIGGMVYQMRLLAHFIQLLLHNWQYKARFKNVRVGNKIQLLASTEGSVHTVGAAPQPSALSPPSDMIQGVPQRSWERGYGVQHQRYAAVDQDIGASDECSAR
jgi:hypothetical protein